MSVATRPRSVRQTLETAKAYQIHPIVELEMMWLANLALALPVPAGWVSVDHPTADHGARFWHNQISGTSQWSHPIDDYIKACLKMCRAPSHNQVVLMRAESCVRREPVLLTGEPTATVAETGASYVEKETAAKNQSS